MEFTKGTCPQCGKYNELLFSNNPLVQPICFYCANNSGLDFSNLEHADFFCRTYNIPFDPDRWTKLYLTNEKSILKIYTVAFLGENKDNLYYTTTTKDLWKEANKEWERALTHAELVAAIEPIKKSFMQQGQIKWGAGYSFIDLMQLENLFTTTIASFDVNNPMQIDSIKKACKLSIMVDRAIANGEEGKTIKELAATHSNYIKTAKIDEMIESAQTDVIRTVADLVDLLEKEGFKFDYYDNVERDIVDKTINIIKEYLRTLVFESTGMEQTLETIQAAYEKNKFTEADKEAQEKLPIEELVKVQKEKMQEDIDKEYENQSIMEDEGGYDEDDF